jgi:hypothetical protein
VPERALLRRLVAALFILALLFCVAFGSSAADLARAIPALAFCFFVLLTQFAFVRPLRNRAVRLLCLRVASGPRAPPQA